MREDWKASITKIAYWKQIANENDALGALPWHLPRVAASPAKIADAERHMGVSFSLEYREFLTFADGWQGFCITTDLFGTQDFLSDRARCVLDRPDLQEFIAEANLAAEFVVPVGASDVDMDVFLLISELSEDSPGEIIWIAGREIDRYPSFQQFFEAMVNYNARIAQQLAAQH
jgi:hypothetical protein